MTEQLLLERKIKLDIREKTIGRESAALHKEKRNLSKLQEAMDKMVNLFSHDSVAKAKLLSPRTYKQPLGRLDFHIADMHYSGKRDDKRVRKFFTKQLTVLKGLHFEGQNVRLAFLGDDIEGELHLSSLDKHQEETTTAQVIGIQQHYLDFIKAAVEIVGDANLIDVAFVTESNHGQIRVHGMSRGQQPRNDVGYIIRKYLVDLAPEGVKFWDCIDGVVETNDTFYMHGDKPYMNSAIKLRLHFGTVKHIVLAHFHTFKVSQHGEQYIMVAPKATSNEETYAKEAGYPVSKAAALFVEHNKKGDLISWKLSMVN